MKFLRLAFYVLIAQLVLSGCAGEGVEETSSSSSSEINFDAYLGRNASTRAGVTDIASLKKSGFGVFARYKHTDGTISPLMDNEHVTWNGDHWGYTNTRYWPNEGTVDFYAFAPYLENVELVKDPKSNDANPTYIEFTSSTSPVDLVWGAQTGKNALTSQTPDGKVKFQFKHALARLGFDITVNQKLEENGAVIIVKEVKLYGNTKNEGAFDIKGYLNLENGTWSVDSEISTRAVYTWTPTGAEDGTFKLTASQLDHTREKIENASNSYLCIIPHKKHYPFYLQITYTVQQGVFFQEEVTVRKNLLDVHSPFPFEQGKAYVFHLILSLDPVNFNISTTVEKWGVGKNE